MSTPESITATPTPSPVSGASAPATRPHLIGADGHGRHISRRPHRGVGGDVLLAAVRLNRLELTAGDLQHRTAPQLPLDPHVVARGQCLDLGLGAVDDDVHATGSRRDVLGEIGAERARGRPRRLGQTPASSSPDEHATTATAITSAAGSPWKAPVPGRAVLETPVRKGSGHRAHEVHRVEYDALAAAERADGLQAPFADAVVDGPARYAEEGRRVVERDASPDTWSSAGDVGVALRVKRRHERNLQDAIYKRTSSADPAVSGTG